MLRIAMLHHPVTALGPGVRFGVWTQGCSIGCAGCMSPHTWDPEGGLMMDVEAIVDQVAACDPLDGVTISGGEPFEQPAALHELLTRLHELRHQRAEPFDLLGFSGLPYRRLRSDHDRTLRLFDAVVPEPYVAGAGRGTGIGGSANQALVALTDLGVQIHTGSDERIPMQVVDDGERIVLIGTPAPGDLARLTERLALAGIDVEAERWRT